MISPLEVPNLYNISLGYLSECDQAYGSLAITSLIIADIGADWGCSPYWFEKHGASKVIAFESEPKSNALLKQLAYGDPQIEVHGAWMGEYVPADILKIDIEGGEILLTDHLLERYSQWAIALHKFLDPAQYKRLETMLESRGGKITYRTGDGIETVWTKAL